MVDRILLTNLRLLAVNVSDGKIKYRAGHREVVEVVAESSWAGATLAITRADGTNTVFKSMDAADAEAIRDQLNSLGDATHPVDTPAADAGGDATDGETAAQVADEPCPFAKVGATVKKAYTDKQAANRHLAESNAANYGTIVKKGTFGLKAVEIYDSGHVRVGLLLTSETPFEKLRSIKFSFQVQDRSGPAINERDSAARRARRKGGAR